jgi:tetratricopeptide (TPR) repeat protein
MARHWAACDEARLAIENWIDAGRKAMQQSACIEAVAHFRAGLKQLTLLPEGLERDRLEFSLQAGLGVVLQATQGYGSEEATQANLRAAALGGQMAAGAELFQTQWTQVMNTIAGLGARAAIEPARLLLAATRQHGDPLQMQAAHYALADAAFWFGDFSTAHEHSTRLLDLYRPEQHQALIERYGEDLQISGLAYQAWSGFFLGHADQARQTSLEMLDRARALDHPHTLALALCFAAVLHRWLGRPVETLALGAETIVVSQQHGFPVWLAAGEMTHGWALVQYGQAEPGLAELRSSIARMRMAIGGLSVVFLSALAEALVFLHQTDAALDVLAEAFCDIQETGDGHFTAELYRLRGECLLKRDGDARLEGETCLRSALDLSRRQQAQAIELRVLKSMRCYPKMPARA